MAEIIWGVVGVLIGLGGIISFFLFHVQAVAALIAAEPTNAEDAGLF